MSRDFNQNRIANAVLKDKRVNSVGNFYAFQDNADGYNVLNVESLPSVKLMTGTNEDITEFAFFNDQNNYGGIGAYSLSALPNLKTIYIYQNSGSEETLDIDLHAFETNIKLEKIYVHPNMKAKYMTDYGFQIAYGTTTIGDLLDEYSLVDEFEIPTMLSGDTAPTTLTNEWLVRSINEVLGDNQVWKNVITKIVVPSYFTSISVGAFNLSNLNMNYVTELKCNGAKAFNAGFLNGASWCIHLWLDNGSSTFNGAYVNDGTTVLNANFRTLAPYLVFANYFMSEYPSEYPVVGYNQFVGGDDLPRTSPTGEYLWFSNINFNADYESPTGLENDPSFIDDYEASSSGYYYCYDKTTTLVIQGSGALTSAIIESAINGLDIPLEWITKVVINSGFTTLENSCLSTLQSSFANLNELSLWCYGTSYQSRTMLQNLGLNYQNINKLVINAPANQTTHFDADLLYNEVVINGGDMQNPSSSVVFGTVTKATFNCGTLGGSGFTRLFRGNNLLEKAIFGENCRMELGFNTSFPASNYNAKVYFLYNGLWNTNNMLQQATNIKYYVPQNQLINYITNGAWANNVNNFAGFFTYDGTLPTFTGYTPTFYEDEDCTITIVEQDMVVGTQYYVKLA